MARFFAAVGIGVVVAFTWLGIWAGLLHIVGIRALPQKSVSREIVRNRLKKLGKLRYILIHGVLGYGLAFGLALTVVDWVSSDHRDWVSQMTRLVLLTLLVGWFQGARTWNDSIRDPVPFPPDYGDE